MKIGFAMCGSFCTFQPVLCELERFCNRFEDVVPIMSEISGETYCTSDRSLRPETA